MSDANNPPTAGFAVLCPECGKHFSSPSLQPGAYAHCTHCDAVFPYAGDVTNKPKAAVPQSNDTRPSDFDDDFGDDRPSKPRPLDEDEDDEDRPRKRRPAARRDRDDDDDDERPRRRSRSREDDDDEDDDRPRRKKRRKKRSRSGEDFDLLDAIPLDYSAQIQIAAGVGVLFTTIGAIMFAAKNDSSYIMYILGVPFWSWACAAAARSAGRSAFNGFYGLLGIIGFFVVHTTNQRG